MKWKAKWSYHKWKKLKKGLGFRVHICTYSTSITRYYMLQFVRRNTFTPRCTFRITNSKFKSQKWHIFFHLLISAISQWLNPTDHVSTHTFLPFPFLSFHLLTQRLLEVPKIYFWGEDYIMRFTPSGNQKNSRFLSRHNKIPLYSWI